MRLLLAVILVGLTGPVWAQSIRGMMTEQEARSTGLYKLNAKELAALDDWLKKFVPKVAQAPTTRHRATPSRGSGPTQYEIEKESDGEVFIINGEIFKAKTWCSSFSEGDRVVFVEGSPYGACLSAKLLNMRNSQTCDVWCD